MKKTASSLTVALLLAAASASAFAQEQPVPTPTFPQDISLKAQRGGFASGSEPVFEALGIESTAAGSPTEIYLTADGTQAGGQLDLTDQNLYFGGDGKVVVKGANVKNDATVDETYNRTKTAFAFVVAGGEVVFDGVDAGNIKQNLSVGTAYSEAGTATLTIQNGAQLETTATGGVLLESGAKLVLEDDAVWTASGDVTLKSGAEMTVSIATTGNAADITFSNSAELAFESGAVLNLTLGENETLEVLQDKSRIYLGEIFEGATLSVYDDMTVGILTFGGKSELGRYDVQEEADGELFIVIPEPSAFGLLAGALALVCAASRRRRK